MADISLKYGTGNQNITITLASLADASYRQSASVSNTTNLYVDVLVGGTVTTGTSPTADRSIVVYAYGSVGGTTVFSGAASGSDAAYSPTSNTNENQNLKLLGIISTSSASNHAYEFGPFSLAASFGGVVPSNWGIVMYNDTGAALNATGGNHDIEYQGIEYQTV